MPDSALDAIFKAYDVRGIYPDEIDESIARRIGNAFVAFTGAARVLVGRDAAPVVRAAGRRLHRGRARSPAPTSSTSGWPPPTSATSPPAASTRRPRCSPPATTRPSTTASSCAGPGRCPIGEDTGLAEIKAMVAGGLLERAEDPGRVERRDLLPAVRRPRPLVRRPRRAPAPAGRRRHRQRRRRPHRARGVRRPAVRAHDALRRARRHVPEPPRRPHQRSRT